MNLAIINLIQEEMKDKRIELIIKAIPIYISLIIFDIFIIYMNKSLIMHIVMTYIAIPLLFVNIVSIVVLIFLFFVWLHYGFFGSTTFDDKDLPLCPLHGKICKK